MAIFSSLPGIGANKIERPLTGALGQMGARVAGAVDPGPGVIAQDDPRRSPAFLQSQQVKHDPIPELIALTIGTGGLGAAGRAGFSGIKAGLPAIGSRIGGMPSLAGQAGFAKAAAPFASKGLTALLPKSGISTVAPRLTGVGKVGMEKMIGQAAVGSRNLLPQVASPSNVIPRVVGPSRSAAGAPRAAGPFTDLASKSVLKRPDRLPASPKQPLALPVGRTTKPYSVGPRPIGPRRGSFPDEAGVKPNFVKGAATGAASAAKDVVKVPTPGLVKRGVSTLLRNPKKSLAGAVGLAAVPWVIDGMRGGDPVQLGDIAATGQQPAAEQGDGGGRTTGGVSASDIYQKAANDYHETVVQPQLDALDAQLAADKALLEERRSQIRSMYGEMEKDVNRTVNRENKMADLAAQRSEAARTQFADELEASLSGTGAFAPTESTLADIRSTQAAEKTGKTDIAKADQAYTDALSEELRPDIAEIGSALPGQMAYELQAIDRTEQELGIDYATKKAELLSAGSTGVSSVLGGYADAAELAGGGSGGVYVDKPTDRATILDKAQPSITLPKSGRFAEPMELDLSDVVRQTPAGQQFIAGGDSQSYQAIHQQITPDEIKNYLLNTGLMSPEDVSEVFDAEGIAAINLQLERLQEQGE